MSVTDETKRVSGVQNYNPGTFDNFVTIISYRAARLAYISKFSPAIYDEFI